MIPSIQPRANGTDDRAVNGRCVFFVGVLLVVVGSVGAVGALPPPDDCSNEESPEEYSPVGEMLVQVQSQGACADGEIVDEALDGEADVQRQSSAEGNGVQVQKQSQHQSSSDEDDVTQVQKQSQRQSSSDGGNVQVQEQSQHQSSSSGGSDDAQAGDALPADCSTERQEDRSDDGTQVQIQVQSVCEDSAASEKRAAAEDGTSVQRQSSAEGDGVQVQEQSQHQSSDGDDATQIQEQSQQQTASDDGDASDRPTACLIVDDSGESLTPALAMDGDGPRLPAHIVAMCADE